MIKLFCDACKEEMRGSEDGSVFKYIKTMILSGKNSQPTQVEEMFCATCTCIIKESINKLRK